MKKYLFTLVLTSFMLYSCGEEEKYVDQGTVLGTDSLDCLCCGGWFININNYTYRFHNLPSEKDINLETDTIYPYNVELDWSEALNGCEGANEIIISRIRKK